jgi:cobalamin biosynthesis protein CobD/CbiB
MRKLLHFIANIHRKSPDESSKRAYGGLCILAVLTAYMICAFAEIQLNPNIHFGFMTIFAGGVALLGGGIIENKKRKE